jgi:hypothetical protein
VSQLAAWQRQLTHTKCHYCDRDADVNCDVRVGFATCSRPCCPEHSAATCVPWLHRCIGHHTAMNGPLRDLRAPSTEVSV